MHSITALPLTLAVLLLQQTIAMPTYFEDITTRFGLQSRAELKILAPIVVGLYVCTDPDWKGTCADLKNGPGICINFNETFSGKISSVGPDSEVSGCTLFQKAGCDLSGESVKDIKKPGIADLTKSPQAGKYDNYFESYICY